MSCYYWGTIRTREQKRRQLLVGEEPDHTREPFTPRGSSNEQKPMGAQSGRIVRMGKGRDGNNDLMVLSVFLILKNPDKNFEF